MKTFEFINGKIRFENQIRNGISFKSACILWNCFDSETGKPLPHLVREATEKELKAEEIRLAEIKEEYQEVSEYNEKISQGNERVVNATTIDDFLNAYKK